MWVPVAVYIEHDSDRKLNFFAKNKSRLRMLINNLSNLSLLRSILET